MKRLLVLSALAGAVLFVLPSTASAQIPAESWGNDHCAVRSGDNNNGPFVAPDPFNWVFVGVAPGGAGSVAAAMHGTGAQECLRVPDPKTCPPSCSMEVQTVCEFHCFHNHTAPFPWWVRLTAQPQPGYFFLGWSANCSWGKTADRTWCIVHMQTDQNVTANFGTAPDAQAPSAPGLSAQPVGPFSVNLSWTPSSDAWLAGYDVYQGSTLVDRVGRGATSYKVENLRCQTSYSFRVEAFDSTGNPGSSATVSARTGTCPGGGETGTVPNTVIHVKPSRVTRSRTAFFHFGARAGSVAATRYRCKLDRGRWVRCSGRLGKRYRNLRRGYHTFQVRAGNANGFDRTPSRWRWRIR
jgi:fibronectin type III domain protein/List-Bact-rpt repeat protein